jgi:hypothetical protein
MYAISIRAIVLKFEAEHSLTGATFGRAQTAFAVFPAEYIKT